MERSRVEEQAGSDDLRGIEAQSGMDESARLRKRSDYFLYDGSTICL